MCAKVPPSKPVAAVTSLGSRALDRPPILLLWTSFLTRLPSLSLHGSSKALLGDLIAWHAEIERATAEHATACLAWDAALAHVLQADNCRRLAWNNFANLVGQLDSTLCRDKGKRCKSPVSVHDDSDLGIAGFAEDNAGDGDSGEDEDEEDGKDEDEDDNNNDENGDEDWNSGGTMDVS